MRLLYSFFIQIYTLAIRLFALVNEKAKLWIDGRKDWKQKIKAINFGDEQVFWFHCASLGEFEQGRPLIEQIKSLGNNKVLLTFFSPSGFELRKNYAHADWIFYLPSDTKSNAVFFVNYVNPKAAFFIKYEFWFNYLSVLKKNEIPTFLVSGIFRVKHHFFKWYGTWAAQQLKAFSCFFVQNQESLQLLKSIGYQNVLLTGDTRFDRVLQIMNQRKRYAPVEWFVKDSAICVVGSSYLEDEKILKSALLKSLAVEINFKLIIAPHIVSPQRIDEIESLFGNSQCVRCSQLSQENASKRVLIIDNIGMLSSLYGYAKLAYIGGGFGHGIHNTLEAAVYGIPLIFGNNYQKFEEARALVKIGAAKVVSNEQELISILLNLLSDQTELSNAGLKSSNYVKSEQGALKKIMNELITRKIIN
jgi:3-deoxy-D-manno-octulosonic-acid transferase